MAIRENHDLRQALAAHHNIDPGHITIGEGIDGLLLTLTRLTVAPGGCYFDLARGPIQRLIIMPPANGGTLHMVPYLNDHEDPQSLAEQAHHLGAKLVYFANPDNPMGSWHSADPVQDLIDNLPDSSLLVLDEAYIDLAPKGDSAGLATRDR
jgi:histidinol-phosphate aminotransferase